MMVVLCYWIYYGGNNFDYSLLNVKKYKVLVNYVFKVVFIEIEKCFLS